MRNMSFSLTTRQIQERTKTITRRLGWKFLKPGDLIQACEKCMGLKPGGRLNKLAVLRVKSVRREPLNLMKKEQFYGLTQTLCEGFFSRGKGINQGAEFVQMFCKHMKCKPNQVVTVIEFEYL